MINFVGTMSNANIFELDNLEDPGRTIQGEGWYFLQMELWVPSRRSG